jgi:hypothetical protein
MIVACRFRPVDGHSLWRHDCPAHGLLGAAWIVPSVLISYRDAVYIPLRVLRAGITVERTAGLILQR